MKVEVCGTITRRVGRERPDITIGWRGDDGELLDFNALGATFQLKIAAEPNGTAILTKTSGISVITGDTAANVRISFSQGELDPFTAGRPYWCQLDSIEGGPDRGFQDFLMLFTPAET